MDSFDKLKVLFESFPGIGPRQASRFVYFLLRKNPQYRHELSERIRDIARDIKQCATCQRFFSAESTRGNECRVCSDTTVDRSLLMLVERDSDLEAINRSGVYDGRYFVLGGSLPVLEKEPERKIRINDLHKLIEREGEVIQEIIFALSVTPQGEHTKEYLEENLAPLLSQYSITVSTLGRGVSTGTELEYVDKDTILHALKGRK